MPRPETPAILPQRGRARSLQQRSTWRATPRLAGIARRILVFGIAAGIAAACHSRAGAVEPAEFVLQWGGPGALAGKFVSPRAVAVNAEGRVIVPDDSGRLQHFDAEGKLLDEWGGNDDLSRMFKNPTGAVVAPTGNIYVAAGIMIREYDSSGETVGRWGTPRPQGIAVDPEGGLYVTDGQNQRILKFSDDGTLLLRFGQPGSASGELKDPVGIAVDSKQNIYVVDSGNARVQKFDRSGKPVGSWGTKGSEAGQFDAPQGICIDRRGRVYVVDQKNNRVQQFDGDGKFLSQWGSPGSGPGQFDAPSGIAVDREGNVYVTDTGNHRIEKFRVK